MYFFRFFNITFIKEMCIITRPSGEIIYESLLCASLQVLSVITDRENTRKKLRARQVSRTHDVIN